MKKKLFILFVSLITFPIASFSQIDTSRKVLFRISLGTIRNQGFSQFNSAQKKGDGKTNETSFQKAYNTPNYYYGLLTAVDASFKTSINYFRINLGLAYTFSQGKFHYNNYEGYKDPGGTNIILKEDWNIYRKTHRLALNAAIEYRFFNRFFIALGLGVNYIAANRDMINGTTIKNNNTTAVYDNTIKTNTPSGNLFFISTFLKTGYDLKLKNKAIGIFAEGNLFYGYKASWRAIGIQFHL